MKLDFLIKKQEIFSINTALPEGLRWPCLRELLKKTDAHMPTFSSATSGSGIYIGWACKRAGTKGRPDSWLYHHTITTYGSGFGNGQPYGFHEPYALQDVLAGRIIAEPIFNVGDFPESAKFARILRTLGIKAYVNMPALEPIQPYERNRNNRHTRVL
jgi:hypothetical protein